MLGDIAVAVNPTDERYTALIGKKVRVPSPESTAAPTAKSPSSPTTGPSPSSAPEPSRSRPRTTPTTSPSASATTCPAPRILDETAHIHLPGSPYDGLDRYEARERIVADLEAQGLLESIKDHTNSIGLSQRTGVVIEPRLSLQWFLAVNKTPNTGGNTIAQNAIDAVESINGEKPAIHFTPEMYEKTYLEWMTNIHDWCISRQLWWGHRIPAWHCDACGGITVSRDTPTTCGNCNSTDITQETDVLDTWFSSGLLPFTTFGWPNADAERQTATHRRPRQLLPHLAPRHRLRHPLLLGRPHDHARLPLHARRPHARRQQAHARRRRPLPRGLHPRPRPRRQPREDVQDQGQRHRPHRHHRALRHRRRPLHPRLAWPPPAPTSPSPKPAPKATAPSPTRSGTPPASSS